MPIECFRQNVSNYIEGDWIDEFWKLKARSSTDVYFAGIPTIFFSFIEIQEQANTLRVSVGKKEMLWSRCGGWRWNGQV